MKSIPRTIIYSCIALAFMGLFVFCCVHNGAILPAGLAQYIGQGAVTITDTKMLFEILGMIYPFFAILLLAPLTSMLLRRGCNAVGLLVAVLWTALVFVMEIFYASDLNGNTVGLLNMDFAVADGNIGWLYIALIVICGFSSVLCAVGFGERFDDLLSEDYFISDRIKGIGLSILFSNLIMTAVAFVTFIPPVVIAFINYGITGEDIPTILHAFIAEKAIISLIAVGSVMGIVASIYIWIYIIKGARFVLSGELFRGTPGRTSSSSSGIPSFTYKDLNGIEHKSESERAYANGWIIKKREEYRDYLEGRSK